MQPERKYRVLLVSGWLSLLLIVLVLAHAFIFSGKSAVPGNPVRNGPAEMQLLVKPLAPDDSYVGSQKCAACHSDIVQKYKAHPMAHSLAEISAANPVEDYVEHTSFSPPGARRFRIERTNDVVVHHESMVDAQDQLIYDQGVRVDYVLGSGKQGRSYLIDREGIVFMSPISWYSKQRRWDLSPNYDPQSHLRFERRVGDACLACHAGRLAFGRNVPDRYQEPLFLETAIGCERCHGTGRRHVDRHSSAASDNGPDTIVNPKHLDPQRREDVCNQCHLQGEGRVLRYGRMDLDFRPGKRLEEVWTVGVRGDRVGRSGTTRAVSHVEQMHGSTCFLKSDGRLGCTFCHDPHSVPARSSLPDFYDSRCVKCHQDQGCSLSAERRQRPPAGGSCIYCHMSSLAANDIPHTSQTDHRILRRPDNAAFDGPGTLMLFDGAEKRLLQLEVDRARGIMLVQAAERERNKALAITAERLLRPFLRAATDDIDVLDALARACAMQQRPAEAETFWREALRLQPDREGILWQLAMFYGTSGNLDAERKSIERLLAINPWNASVHGRYAHVLGRLGETERGIQSAKRALELDPSLTSLYVWLADALQKTNDLPESRRYRELFQKVAGATKSP